MATTIQLDARKAISFEQIVVDATAGGKALTSTKYRLATPNASVPFPNTGGAVPPLNAKSCLITVEGSAGTNDIRVTFDGTAPTSTVGHLVVAGSSLNLDGTANIAAFRAIRAGGTSGNISVTYFE